MPRQPSTYYWDDEPVRKRGSGSDSMTGPALQPTSAFAPGGRLGPAHRGSGGFKGIAAFALVAVSLGGWALHTFVQRVLG